MRQGFIRVAAVTPKVTVADPAENAKKIVALAEDAAKNGAKIIVFPELCITAYSCGDLFLQETLLREAKTALIAVAEQTKEFDALLFVGLPYEHLGKLYNVAAAINHGKILGLVPKTCIPNYGEFYEARHFARGMKQVEETQFLPELRLPIGTDQIFCCDQMPELRVAAEICEDLWTPQPPSIAHVLAGANVIVNLSASDETTGKDRYRTALVAGQSARLLCGYVYASAGDGESTQDVVYSGHNIIAENGTVLKEAKRFANETVYSEFDIFRLNAERRKMTTFEQKSGNYVNQIFHLKSEETTLTRFIDPAPFVPGSKLDRDRRCEEILSIQSMGLKKRLEHTHCKNAVVGISGGLDSTLALLVTVRAFDLLGLERGQITAVTMPGFGTTDRTYENAVKLIRWGGLACLHLGLGDLTDGGEPPVEILVLRLLVVAGVGIAEYGGQQIVVGDHGKSAMVVAVDGVLLVGHELLHGCAWGFYFAREGAFLQGGGGSLPFLLLTAGFGEDRAWQNRGQAQERTSPKSSLVAHNRFFFKF